MFINHDVSQKVFNNYKADKLPKFYGCIEIGNNVFIGARATILPNVSICDNVLSLLALLQARLQNLEFMVVYQLEKLVIWMNFMKLV